MDILSESVGPYILVVADFVGLVAHLGVFLEYGVHVCAGVLEELGVGVEDDQRYVAAAQHAQLHSLLHQPVLALCEGDLQGRFEL